ncbi:tyrosine--tRNA ligase [Akkermansia sp. N21169]|jgi:tyrosyl-tRNA synthetase|uniref:tyrosine--tRNA ligase n=1 Tax=unclassified Akkermansia TaxID=2608915 RepID=UPI00244EC402|nr:MULTISPECIES: tyrosine--tRNA ligase [unclassified Akkermansia]MDH3067687.1 tyrosine--tRNA ligase [Akkermansia sp. N21169]WPX41633.1 tyrosine--tRNA ligase [Akkermansia sp. N21116]
MTIDEQLDFLMAGTAKVIGREELKERLSLGRPLRVKLGVDPTAPDIHLGHTVAIEKLRQFQQLGHQAILLIGDFTAMIGDPTGRSVTRPPLSREQVLANAETYTQQAFKILDRAKTEIVYNGDWFRKMSYDDVLKLNSRATMQQMLAREDFRARVDSGKEVRLHELQYPLMQGWDSVMIQADVELGGTDQLFNILVGRDLQKEEGLLPQIAMTLPLLEGLDGVRKMSKSYGNYVGVDEAAETMFGKMMSVSDELMDRYYTVLLGEHRDASLHPMEAKKLLAWKIVARYHSPEAADAARNDWETRFSKRDLAAAELPELSLAALPAGLNAIGLVAYVFQTSFNVQKSNGVLRKEHFIPGAIQVNDEKVTDPNATLELKEGDILRLSKKHAVRFIG